MNSAPTTMKNSRIEAILPLNHMQQGLLLHHLSSQFDQGFLNVQCKLTGRINRGLWESAWGDMCKRHAVMRTAVRWKELDKPLQIILEEMVLHYRYEDWSNFSDTTVRDQLESLKKAIRQDGPDLEKGPLSTLYLITLAEEEYIFLWPSHHILIDGWSSHIIIHDFILTYNAISGRKQVELETLPSHKSFLNWLNQQDPQPARAFWKKEFESFTNTNLFNATQKNSVVSVPEVLKITLTSTLTAELTAYARGNKVTINTILLGAWALLLGNYFNSTDVVMGTTVSGRSGEFPNLHLLSGMYMNVQPIRVQLSGNKPFPEWFTQIQAQQQEARKYEHMSLDEITETIKWPSGRLLSDSLLIFENYAVAYPTDGQLRVTEMRSGLTSNFPVTLVIIPGDQISFSLSFFPDVVNRHISEWLLAGLKIILNELVVENRRDYNAVRLKLEIPPRPKEISEKSVADKSLDTYLAPTNEIELKLVQIWESVFGTSPIGVNDNFFALGGKSLMAVKLFTIINQQLDWKFSPTTILEYPTIAALAQLKFNGQEMPGNTWRNLVPIRARGTRNPLFCLHAGGGHVFFYRPLAEYMNSNRPVYGLQPSGIFGKDKMHESIEEMARDYVDEIRKVQPHGPYNLLVYCFSTALGLEMAQLFSEAGQGSNLIIMDTMTDQEQLLTRQRFSMRFKGFLKRISKSPVSVFQNMISDRIDTHIKPRLRTWFGSTEVKSAERIRLHLKKIYNEYTWITYKGQVTLILTPKAHDSFNEELVRSWQKVALGGVKTEYTQGTHRSIFEEPEVAYAADAIEKCCV